MSGFRKTLTVRRRAAGDYNSSGFYETTGADTEIEIKASVQTVSGSDTTLLPENRREDELLKLYTENQLIGAQKGGAGNCDIVEINGYDYEVVKVFPWQNNVIPHYKVIIAKRTTNDYPPPVQG